MKDPDWLEKGPEEQEKKEEEGPKMVIDVPSLRSITISVRGKRLFHEGLTPEQVKAGENLDQEVMRDMEPIVMEHGRHALLVFRLKNGTKQQYRGNGGVICGAGDEKPTEFAKGLLTENRMRKLRLEIRKRMLEEGMDENVAINAEQISEKLQEIGNAVT